MNKEDNKNFELYLEEVNEQKHLGLIIDSGLSFKKHLDEKIIIAKKT